MAPVMSTVSASSVSYLLFTLVIGFIAIPLCLYSILRFYHYRDDRRFRKRHGKLSTFTALCFVGELFSGCLLTLAFSNFLPTEWTIALAWLGDILNFTFYFLIIHCLVLRFWSLYYDIRYQLATKDNLWKSIIDENFVVNEEHLSQLKSYDIDDDLWFIKRKQFEGSTKWVIRTWIVRSLVTMLSILGLMISIETIYSVGLRRGIIEVIFTLLFFIPWFFMIWIYHKIPPFHDPYFIHKEVTTIHNLDLVDVLASAVVSIIANYGIYSANTASSNPYAMILENQWLNTLMIVTFWIMGLSHCIIVYIMTFWVRHEIIKDEAHHLSMTRRFSSNGTSHLDLDTILEHQLGYELFMEHLNNEMSGENLLSLTEFIQYKEYIRCRFMGQIDGELVRDKSVSDSKSGWDSIKLPTAYIPKSSIVHNEELTVKQIAYRLYAKYVRSGGELEINLSFETRSAFNGLFDDKTKSIRDSHDLSPKEYLSLFDDCILEVVMLMQTDSLLRFVLSKRYNEVKKAIREEKRLERSITVTNSAMNISQSILNSLGYSREP